MKHLIKNILKFFKIILIKEKNYFNPEQNLYKSIKFHNIRSIIDVGAHEGNFIEKILQRFLFIEAISFEPAKEAFKNLIIRSEKYKNWKILNYALAARDQNMEMNISNYTEASSFLSIEKTLLKFRPELKVVSKELVKCKKIDNFISEFDSLQKPILLKVDTQGYEMEVLKGGNQTLDIIDFVLLEVSTGATYRGQPSLKEVIEYLENKRFKVWSLDRVFGNRSSGETLQVNILFNRIS